MLLAALDVSPCLTHTIPPLTAITSVIPKVIPFCIVNGLLTALIYQLKTKHNFDITTNTSGHKYLAVVMSFLMVSRVKMIYDRYMKSSASLSNVFRACRELVQMTCLLTNTDQTQRAKQWRHDVAHAVIIMLRVTMAVLDFRSNPSQMPWALTDIDRDDTQDIQDNLFVSVLKLNIDDQEQEHNNEPSQQHSPSRTPRNMLAHTTSEQRTLLEEACRAPVVMALNVRQEIMKQRDGTWVDRTPNKVWFHDCNEELRLLDFVGCFLHDYHNLRQLIVTPVPFPLVNMAKIIMFVWVVSVPFSICHFTFESVTVPVTIIVLITFGFIGLEYVSMELSDPFGDDVSVGRDKMDVAVRK